MDISALLERSKVDEKNDFTKIPCREDKDPLVDVESVQNIKVEPIWQVPVDPFEGPLYQEYVAQHPEYDAVYVRQQVAARLQQVGQSLPEDWVLVLRAGHRPKDVQIKLLNKLKEKHLSTNPQATEAEALEFARIFVSDPAVKMPPHCCGAAVDVDVLNSKTGELVDFGCSVNTDSEVAFLHTSKINDQQRGNRLALLTAMLKAGFASCSTEWWHYSYGDQAWAVFYNHPQSLYGLIEPNL